MLRSKAPVFKSGDKLFIDFRKYKTTRPIPKFDYDYNGPFEIISQIIPVNYKIELPDDLKIHNVFRVSSLKRAKESTRIPGRHLAEPQPVVVEDHFEYEVEGILDARKHGNKIEYFVQWCRTTEQSWVSHDDTNCDELLKEFYSRHPEKPGYARFKPRQKRKT